MLTTVIGYYSIIALVVFLAWFKAFWNDSTTSKTDLSSWMVLIIGASLWVIVVPFANLELVTKVSTTDTY
ncbi:hypothetical protein [Aphanothece sacrum]|uniref:Cell division protein FtsK n=1 Tax=Aphanothece sacrum FPU1 TaxID=1920663 RepID=A0A401IDX4_APHSA|nr:hypothetical protein [Aphanothece sacrum]GBF79441.1 cell division protein FtsK [Aphanothece sacrum FPU1]GBF86656.1 cell division protein FtsK [Aphanothece sacrum FPU3]